MEVTPLNNDLWDYSEDPDFHIFTSKTGVVIDWQTFSSVGIKARWVSVKQDGQYTISILLDPNSGTENHIENNTDAEKLDFFID